MFKFCYLIITFLTTSFIWQASAEIIPFDDPRWTLVGDDTEVINMDGKSVLSTTDGSAYIADANFENGIIEFDVMFPDDSQGFSGATWRMQPDGSYEHFYIRPHLGNKPDSSQYTPVFHHDTGWQIYFGSNYSAILPIKYKDWTHVKIVVSGDMAEIYVDSSEPVLVIGDLKADLSSGDVGVSSTFAPAYYKDFSLEIIENPHITEKAKQETEVAENLLKTFHMSEAVSDEMTTPETYTGNWTRASVETNGVLNISRYKQRSDGYNTVLIKLDIVSEAEQIKKFLFGYSDDIAVFVKGRPVAGGTNIYQSRDYRYLGTIGLFDHVYLPLETGKNEVYFAVKENFGGWGFMGKFENMDGISVK